ncbi:MAG: hypothetical protein RJA61_224 [Candidatus Parcubacteria bacterium]|jgi:hypothetical protein
MWYDSAIMENKLHMSPKDFFLHGGVIVALYAVVISFLNLAFALIDTLYPPTDAYYYYSYYSSPISWPMAMLIVIFPTLLILSYLLKKDFARDPLKKELGLRKWLVYATLFIAGIVLVGDLVTILYKFLNGDLLTIGFLLKALSVFLVMGAVFTYYVLDLKGKTDGSVNRFAFIGSLIVVLALIIGSFAVLGSPRTQRLMKYDLERVQELQSIQWQVLSFWQQKGSLPENLSELSDPFSGFINPQDPETGESYIYERVSSLTFKLCADFALKSQEVGRGDAIINPIYGSFENETWKHEAGNQCFERTIDPDRFPPRKI